MVLLATLQLETEYQCQTALDLCKSPTDTGLVTQAAAGRHLRLMSLPQAHDPAIAVCLCEDDYPGWLPVTALESLQVAAQPYQAPEWTAAAIAAQIPAIIHFTQAAMAQPNTYLWGGTVGPNFDCSGLMQTAFAASGIRLPRDSYQQEEFVEAVELNDLQPGDLLFFGRGDRPNHVALYLGDGRYIHSSGRDQGRNGIGIDSITDLSDRISATYHQQLRGAGRVMRSYQPQGQPMACR
ncbi:C40 family peptidase [Leptolyngbya iicbica]|uniref:NlpC/P60 family protein n=2 Tax=Cyanophyceae TaxID=3028117 RepID=A0A4Q7EHJ9_9CYAN|nr:C40 family peptidase [Leptolyngbya sp. LK]RZM82597.1 NlpC/P60 family protein [Leptolyngbya sp. LK]